MAPPLTLASLNATIIRCRRCPRLVAYREAVARLRRRQYASWKYWGRPVPGIGDPRARILLVGLAPAAHGGNRTGRMFTGDGSADFLTPALYRAGLVSQPTSVSRTDGLRYRNLYMTAAVRCAPPNNKPLPSEFAHCRGYLLRELQVLRHIRVIVALGAIAHTAALQAAETLGWTVPKPRPAFDHGAAATLVRAGGGRVTLIASYHPSRQNTQTKRLTAPMLDRVIREAVAQARLMP